MSTVEQLAGGPSYRLADWPVAEVPAAPGLYTIWDGARFLYVGIAGRGTGKSATLRSRLNAHAAGRRGGDQLCIYVCDRLIVPELSAHQLAQVGDGRLALDAMTKAYMRDRLSFRFAVTSQVQEAQALERQIKRHGLGQFGKPLLNPDDRPD